MDAVSLLREQARITRDLFGRVLAPVTDQQALWRPDDGKTNPIAATVLHVVFGEDRLVQGQQGKPPIFESAGWAARLPFDPRSPWAVPTSASADALRAYAAEVGEASRVYLEGLRDEDLDHEITLRMGTRPLSIALSMMLVIHKSTHLGEIAALLGCQGLTGFPV